MILLQILLGVAFIASIHYINYIVMNRKIKEYKQSNKQ